MKNNFTNSLPIISLAGAIIFGGVLGYFFGIQSIPKKLTVAKIQMLMDDLEVKNRTVEALITDEDGRKLIATKMMAVMSAKGMLKDIIIRKNGKMLILKQGKIEEMPDVLPTTKGGAIYKDGKVVEQDGRYRSLQEGDIVTLDGEIIKKI